MSVIGCGTIFSLQPPPNVCPSISCPWRETILHSFSGPDGLLPTAEVVFDQAGNFYGTASRGGTLGSGVVWKMTRTDGGWVYSQIYSFPSGSHDGEMPNSSLIFDQAGNLYGTTSEGGGGSGDGTIFELSPSGSGWLETVLYRFQGGNDGAGPYGGVTLDSSGNLYGTTFSDGPPGSDGTAFKLTPAGGTWTFSLLSGLPCGACSTGGGSLAPLLLDSAGNLYGTTEFDGMYNCGSVFKLIPAGGNYTYVSLHDFTCHADGDASWGNVIMDASGNLYGTTLTTAFELTP